MKNINQINPHLINNQTLKLPRVDHTHTQNITQNTWLDGEHEAKSKHTHS